MAGRNMESADFKRWPRADSAEQPGAALTEKFEPRRKQMSYDEPSESGRVRRLAADVTELERAKYVSAHGNGPKYATRKHADRNRRRTEKRSTYRRT